MEPENKEQSNEMKVRRIDQSEINDGETVHEDKIFGPDGNYIKHISYIERMENEIKKGIELINKPMEKLQIIPFSSLMKKEFEKNDWLVDLLIPLGGTTVLSGSPATFKTWVVLDIAIRIASGDVLFGKFPTKQTGVLMIDEESGERMLQCRAKMMCQKFQLPIHFLSLGNYKICDKTISETIKIAKENQIGLIIFDSLVRIHNAEENEATKMAAVFSRIKELNKNGLTVIFTHHNRKQGIFKSDPSQSMRGSSDILASVDCHLAIDRKNREEIITVMQTKNRFAKEIKPFKLGIISNDDKFRFEYLGEADEKKLKSENDEAQIVEALKSLTNGGVDELYEIVKEEIGIGKLRNILKKLKDDGLIEAKKVENNKEVFYLKENTEESV